VSEDPVIAATWLTLKLASYSTVVLLLVGAPLAWWLSRSRARFKPLLEAVIALPLVLPPTVIGFYLLLAFAPQTGLGRTWQALTGSQLSFSFSALVIGSVIYSLPFVVQPLQATFNAIPDGLLEAGSTMGASRWDRMLNIVLPLSRRGLLAASSLGFAHTVGEFGIVLMIGGNIPGQTQVLSIALYDQVELLNYSAAHTIAITLVVVSVLLLVAIYSSQRSAGMKPWH
jgi:molybdate transport system permease protein